MAQRPVEGELAWGDRFNRFSDKVREVLEEADDIVRLIPSSQEADDLKPALGRTVADRTEELKRRKKEISAKTAAVKDDMAVVQEDIKSLNRR